MEHSKLRTVLLWIFRILGIALIVGSISMMIYFFYHAVTFDNKQAYYVASYFIIMLLIGVIMTYYGFKMKK